jgi:hypothetical protein
MDTAAFVTLIRDELGLPVTPASLDVRFDELDRWDSVYLLKLVASLDLAAGRRIPVPALLRAQSLREVHQLVAAGAP